MTGSLCFIDTETDSLGPRRKAWEIAIIRRDEIGLEEEWQVFLDIDLSTADPHALKVGRYYERHPVGRHITGRSLTHPGVPTKVVVHPAIAANRIAQLTHDTQLVGINPSFDSELLDRLLRGHGYLPHWDYHLIDVVPLAAGALAGRGQLVDQPWRSADIAAALGVQPALDADRHTALGDARWTRDIYDAALTPSRSA